MYGRRRFSSGRRSYGGFRRPPVARKQRFWIQQIDNQTEVAGTVTSFTLLDWTLIPGLAGMSALSKGVRLVRTLFILTSGSLATDESRQFGVLLDDASDVGANAWNPGSSAAANQRVPDRVFRWGGLMSRSTAALAAGALPPVFVGNRDAVRDVKLGAILRPDSRLFLNVSFALAAPNQLAFSLQARTLIEIG